MGAGDVSVAGCGRVRVRGHAGAARRFFHIDAQSVVVAVLTELAREGHVDRSVLKQAIDRYQLLDVAAADPGVAGATRDAALS
ncbi:hypothetical protein SHKM778_75140 [Streptomyces sp. KM77-8]|uniref:Uncharacterized protein n=1 Tax=Streptomyces haneummycinicus TaxID=3074435 RepID=A0AAT9HUC9_9ACTN